jgi:sugar (glycoside-pentoside-hexuronide) transporter
VPASARPASSPTAISEKEIVGYSIGDLGINLHFQLIGFFLAYFYTDVFGISAANVAGLLFVARVWDAANDPVIGWIADRTRTRWGRMRPYLLFASIPLGVALVACFFTPDLGHSAKLAYAYGTYMIHGSLFTVVGLPYSALSAVVTQDQHVRSKISSYRMFFAVIVAVSIVAIAVRPFLTLFDSERTGFAVVALIFAIVSVGLVWVSFFSTRERVEPDLESYSLRDAFRLIIRNEVLLTLGLAMFFSTCVWVCGNTVALYYFKYVLNDLDFYSVFFFWMLPANFAAVLAGPYLMRRYGKLRVFMIGSATVALASLIRHWLPTPVVLFIALSLISSMGQMLAAVAQWAMVPDTVEYAEYKLKVRSEGIPFAFFSFTQKVGMAVGAMVAMLILSWTGYTANAAQSEAAIAGISIVFNLVPASFAALCVAALSLYKLRPEAFDRIVLELKARKTQPARDAEPRDRSPEL